MNRLLLLTVFALIADTFSTEHQNVMLVTIDHLPATFNSSALPHLKSIETQGVYFSNVVLSSTSHVANAASLLLGLHASTHNTENRDSAILE